MNARAPIDPFGDDIAAGHDQQVAHLRIPPHSIEAESTVLGGLLLDNGAWDRIGDLLTDNDFYRHQHRLVFAAIGGLINATKPADVFTVYDQLQKLGKADEVGGLPYLNSLAQYVPSAKNIRRYAEIVRERAVLRSLISASDEIATLAFNTQGESLDKVLDRAEGSIFRIGEARTKSAEDWEGMDAGLVRLLDWIQQCADGKGEVDFTPTGFKEIDEQLDGGMRGGELIVIGARPSMGKTALGLNIIQNVALKQGLACGVFSMEMPKAQLIRRGMATIGRIHLSRIKRPERLRDTDWPSITEAVERLRNAPIEINDQGGLNINQIRSKSRALARRHGKLGAIMVDYFSLMDGTDRRQPRHEQLAEASKGLKALAKELNCPLILLQQVKREVETRTDPMPMLSDLRDSGSLEQDADIVMFVHRPFKADPKMGEEFRPLAHLSIPKQRDGETGFLNLHFTGEHQLFADWPTDLAVPRKSGGKGKEL